MTDLSDAELGFLAEGGALMADEVCADCSRPRALTFGAWRQQRGSVLCGAGKYDAAADLQCAEVKIERLEAQLATVEKQTALQVIREVFAAHGMWEDRLAAVAKKYEEKP